MNIFLRKHSYNYAVEQMLFSLFPGEKPVYPEGEPENCTDYLISELDSANLSSHAVLCLNGKTAEASAEFESGLSGGSVEQKLVRLSFYRAAVKLFNLSPPWGSITGVHPAKLAARYILKTGCDEAGAADYLCKVYSVSADKALLAAEAAAASIRVDKSLRSRDVSLYIGIPFCPTRCSYCSFISQSVDKSLLLVEPYLEALYKEIKSAGQIICEQGLEVISIYIGGGTPTTLTAKQLNMLMTVIAENINLRSCREYTVEAGRPDTITFDKLKTIWSKGAGRISINPQTMNDSVLRVIGRLHTGQDIIDSYSLARSAFGGDVNMDLIAGLPTEAFESFKNSLDAVISLNPENITIHTLTSKRGSSLTEEGSFAYAKASAAEMVGYSRNRLTEAGYKPYYLYRQKQSAGGLENVGWCKEGYESIYNIVMMEELQPVISLGAGGVTKLVDRATGKIERLNNKKYPKEYIDSIDNNIAGKAALREFFYGIKKHLQEP
jgi:oxygen-independent coproporphyrinogen-3 oxidase